MFDNLFQVVKNGKCESFPASRISSGGVQPLCVVYRASHTIPELPPINPYCVLGYTRGDRSRIVLGSYGDRSELGPNSGKLGNIGPTRVYLSDVADFFEHVQKTSDTRDTREKDLKRSVLVLYSY